MLGVSIVSVVVQLALYVGGGVVALLLRRRDAKGAALAAAGFGCMVLAVLVSVGEGMVTSAVVSAVVRSGPHPGFMPRIQPVFLAFTVAIELIRLAGFALVFAGILRVIRRAPAPVPGMVRR